MQPCIFIITKIDLRIVEEKTKRLSKKTETGEAESGLAKVPANDDDEVFPKGGQKEDRRLTSKGPLRTKDSPRSTSIYINEEGPDFQQQQQQVSLKKK